MLRKIHIACANHSRHAQSHCANPSSRHSYLTRGWTVWGNPASVWRRSGSGPKVPFEGGMRGGYGAKAAGRLLFFIRMILKTARLTLRPQQQGDALALFTILS